jgi:hypothetical protein
MDASMEFRMFVFGGQLTAVSQYCYYQYFENLAKKYIPLLFFRLFVVTLQLILNCYRKAEIQARILDFFEKYLKPYTPHSNYIIDIAGTALYPLTLTSTLS